MAASSVLHLILCAVVLLSSQPTLSAAQRIPSYTETVSEFASMMRAINSGTADLTISEVREKWPLLFSPTRFEHELVKAMESLAGADGLDARLTANVSAVCVEHMERALSALVRVDGQAWQSESA